MKAKQGIKAASLLTLMITLSNGVIVNAYTSTTQQTKEESVSLAIEEKIDKPCKGHRGRRGGRELFDNTLNELKNSGDLTDEDLKNIEEYHKKLEEERKAQMKKKREEIIDNMVNQKVITAEKGEKLKQALEKNIETKIKEMEQENNQR